MLAKFCNATALGLLFAAFVCLFVRLDLVVPFMVGSVLVGEVALEEFRKREINDD